MEVKKIYFDLDQVLADFNRGVAELCGLEYKEENNLTPAADTVMWGKIREVDHFYDKLKLMQGAKKLFDAVYGKYANRCEILTGIPKPKRGILRAGEDKINWVRRHLSEDIVVNIVFKEQKPEYCTGKDCILIDDNSKNIEAWEAMGGTGILFKSAEKTMTILEEMGVL